MISLAVKYRPSTFGDLIEQDAIKLILKDQIETKTFKQAYLFCGPSGDGKTTTARIFANEINHGQGNPIEMDAASHNGVDDVREISQQAKTQSIDSEYKVYIIDECVTGDVEILTDSGFKRFDECDGTEKVAQYTDDGAIEFVKPYQWIKQNYQGDLVKWNPRNWCSVRMTPHHVQPLLYTKSQKIKEKYISDVNFNQNNNLIVAGRGCGNIHMLSPIDRLVIASQADGTIQHISKDYVHWSIQLTKQRKIDRFIEICSIGNISYSEIRGRDGSRRFTYDLPSTSSKELSTYFNLEQFSYLGARDFINEVVQWDGYIAENYIEYISTIKENCDFVSAVACLGGYSARQRVQIDNRKDSYKNCYKVFLYDDSISNCAYIKDTVTQEYYDGLVYCVKVPTQKIVIRSEGFVFVTGNCHSFSNNAWQAMLKLIEEPPMGVVFIFCTTDPQKIPKTILSRVQRYDFQRISQQGIVNRLNEILAYEKLNVPYSQEAVEYIAKLADGGMRDAITMLDKCISYSNELTIENVVKALGIANYDVMFSLFDSIYAKNSVMVLSHIESLHQSGVDLKQFMRSFMDFLLDICKYGYVSDFSALKMPNIYEVELKSYTNDHYNYATELLSAVLKLNSDIKWDSNPKSMIEAELLLQIGNNE